MWDKNQKTLNNEVSFSGIGLHSGANVDVTLVPANSNSGITFKRTDLDNQSNLIHANFNNVSETKLCTKLTNDFNVSVSTVEHLMAALMGYGIDNARVEIDGPETPILDGSSVSYINAFKKCGVKILSEKRKTIPEKLKAVCHESDRLGSIYFNNNVSKLFIEEEKTI